MRYPPDEVKLIDNRLHLKNKIGEYQHQSQIIDVAIIPIQENFRLIPKEEADQILRKKVSKRQAQQVLQPLRDEEHYFYDSTEIVSSKTLILSKLKLTMRKLRKKGVHFHLLTQPYHKNLALIIVAVFYRREFTQSRDSENTFSPLNGYPKLENMKKLLSFSPRGFSFSSKIKHHPQKTVVDKELPMELVNYLGRYNENFKSMGTKFLVNLITDQTMGKILSICSTQEDFEQFILTYQRIKSYKEDQKIIKFGGDIPKGFIPLDYQRVNLDLLELIDENFLEDYNDLFELGSELFKVYNLGEEFIKFWTLHKDSLDTSERKKFTFDRLYTILKKTPMNLIEIPITAMTKNKLLQFLDSFYHRQVLNKKVLGEDEEEYIPPKLLYLPISHLKSDIWLLFLFLRIEGLRGREYHSIFVDYSQIPYILFQERLKHKLTRFFYNFTFIYHLDYPNRELAENHNKLILNTTSNNLYYLQELMKEQKIAGVSAENNSYFVSGSKKIYKVIDDYRYRLYKKSDPAIEILQIEEIDLTQNNKVIPLDLSIPSKIPEPNVSKKGAVDEFIDELYEKEDIPKMKQEKNSPDKVETTKSEDQTSKVEDQIEDRQDSTPQDPTISENKQEEISEDDLEKKVALFYEIFNIQEFLDSEMVMTPSVLLMAIGEQTIMFSIINRLIHSSKSALEQSDFSEEEQSQLQLAVKRELIGKEVTDTVKYRIIPAGKKSLNLLHITLKNYDKQLVGMSEKDVLNVLDHQKKYGKQPYAISILHWPIYLGIQYYKQFRIVPPEILGIIQVLRIFFQLEDPSHFTDIFRAKYVPIFGKYHHDIIREESKVRQEYIDTREKVVPRPVSETQDDIQEKRDWDMRSSATDYIKKPTKNKDLIVDDNTDNVIDHLKDLKHEEHPLKSKIHGKKRRISKKIKEVVVRSGFIPEQISEDEYNLHLNQKIEKYEEKSPVYDPIKITAMGVDIDQSIALYDPKDDFDLETSLKSVNFQYIKLKSSIKNILGTSKIHTVEDFTTQEFSTDIKGIGESYLKEIEKMQQILSSQFLETDHLTYFLNDDGIAELVSKGAEISPKLLPTQIYYIPEDLISSCKNSIEPLDDPIAIGTQVLIRIITKLKMEPKDNFEELLNQMDKFQKHKFNLLIEDNQQKPLNLVYLISQQSKLQEGKLSLDNIREDILTKINQILLSIQYYH